MKEYKVVVLQSAKKDLRSYIRYLKVVKGNPQAAQNVLDDYRKTREELSRVAGSLVSSDSSILRQRGLKRICCIKVEGKESE